MKYSYILADTAVRAALYQTWQDSNPGVSGGHEEGGFVLQDAGGNLKVIRWPKGTENTIVVPPRSGCKIGDDYIVASFHTHPNTGQNYLQEPSETDKQAVRDDPNLKAAVYVGEFVISQKIIYLIIPTGQVREVEETQVYFT